MPDDTGPSRSRWRRRSAVTARVLVPAVLLAIAWPTALLELAVTPATALPVALLACVPVVLVPEHPWRAWLLSAGGALLVVALVGPAPGHALGLQVVHLVVLAGLTALVAMRAAPWAVAVAAVLSPLLVLLATGSGIATVWAVVTTAAVVAVGLQIRRLQTQRRELARELRATEARRAVLAERARVAHDLHDVVAHAMSMVVVRAETARYRLPDLDEPAVGELAAIADTARTALGEIRIMLGVLRTEEDTAGTEDTPAGRPQPTLEDVDTLLAETAAAGVELTVVQTGERAGTGDAVAVSLYRILAEALANAARHAAGAAVSVTLDHRADGVHVHVTHGPGRPATGPGSGLGLPSMRARAAAVGGELTAGPTEGGGFAVAARLPVAERMPA